MHRLAGQAGGRGAQQANSRGVGETDQAVAVQAADSIRDRVEQNLLLAIEFFGAAPFVGALQHLSQRGRPRLWVAIPCQKPNSQ